MQTTCRFFDGTNWSPAASSGQRGPWRYLAHVHRNKTRALQAIHGRYRYYKHKDRIHRFITSHSIIVHTATRMHKIDAAYIMTYTGVSSTPDQSSNIVIYV